MHSCKPWSATRFPCAVRPEPQWPWPVTWCAVWVWGGRKDECAVVCTCRSISALVSWMKCSFSLVCANTCERRNKNACIMRSQPAKSNHKDVHARVWWCLSSCWFAEFLRCALQSFRWMTAQEMMSYRSSHRPEGNVKPDSLLLVAQSPSNVGRVQAHRAPSSHAVNADKHTKRSDALFWLVEWLHTSLRSRSVFVLKNFTLSLINAVSASCSTASNYTKVRWVMM